MGALAEDLQLARELAEEAGRHALRRFRAADLAVDVKPDGSAVTDADRDGEALLRERLRRARPTDAVLGEEGGRAGRGSRCWLLDPIDGTAHFAAVVARVRGPRRRG